MMKKKIAILILVFLSTFSFVFANFFAIVTDEINQNSVYTIDVSFDARINNENLLGELKHSAGTTGKEVHIPIQTEVHVVMIKKNGDILVETPIIIEIEGENHEVFLDYFSMKNIDKSSYAKELYQSKIQENEQGNELMIRNYLIIAVIAAVVLFLVFSLVFLLIEKKCDSGRKNKILFFFLLLTAILSLFFLYFVCNFSKR